MSLDTPGDIAPIVPVNRIRSIDALRGFALLGILVINVQWMAMIEGAASNPTVYPRFEGVNRWLWIVAHLFVEQKFMTFFSMLFGAGILLMTRRVEARGKSAKAIHYRRMLALLVIGLLHAYFVWYGDILVTYALCGMIVYGLRNWSPRTLIVAGIAVLSVSSILSLTSGWSLPSWPAETLDDLARDWQPGVDAIARDIAAYRGGYLEVFRYRAPSAFAFQTVLFLFWGLWRAGGLMLIGMGLLKLGFFGAQRPNSFYHRLMWIGFLVGLPIVALGIYLNMRNDWAMEYSFLLGGQFNYWAGLFVAMGWIGCVMLLSRSKRFVRATWLLAAVGRMALTNYLMQSILCTWIFYGYGLGLYGHVERLGQLMIVLGVWALQLVASPLWLRRFRFGPAEWLWRSLTYRHMQPIRGRATASIVDESLSSSA